MKSLVVYRSKTGFTKKYAEWIAEELSADIIEAAKVQRDKLLGYDRLIYGGGLYAGGINGLNLITKNLDMLKGKKIIVFATGASPSREEDIIKVWNKNTTPEQRVRIKFFYMRGGFNYAKLKTLDKVLMTLLKIQLKRKKELTADENGMLAAYDTPVDFTNRNNIEELVRYAIS